MTETFLSAMEPRKNVRFDFFLNEILFNVGTLNVLYLLFSCHYRSSQTRLLEKICSIAVLFVIKQGDLEV